jgi:hypothetical protein
MIACIALAAFYGFLGSIMPPTGMDALSYHLALPDQYLIRGTTDPIGTTSYYLFWQQYEFALLPLIAIDPTGRAANAFGFLIYVALVAGCWFLAKRDGGEAAGWIAAAAIATSPLVLNLLVLTKNDLFSCALVVWGVHCLRFDRRALNSVGGLFLGAAIATKPSALFAVLPLFFLVWRLSGAGPLRYGLPAAAILPIYWSLRNWKASGAFFSAAHTVPSSELLAGSSVGSMLSHAVTLLATQTECFFTAFISHVGRSMDGPIGAPPLLLIVAAGLPGIFSSSSPPRSVRVATTAGLIGCGLWILAGRDQARFLLPLIAVWVSHGAAILAQPYPKARFALGLALISSLLASAWIVESEHHVIGYHSGRVSADALLKDWLASYDVQRIGDRTLPPDAYVLAVGEAELFYLHRKADFDGYWEASRALALAHDTHDSVVLRTELKKIGYTHLLCNGLALTRLLRLNQTMSPLSCSRDLEVFLEMANGLELVAANPAEKVALWKL